MSGWAVVAVLTVSVLVVASALGWALPRHSRFSLLVGAALGTGLGALGLVAVLHGEVTTSGGVVAAALLVDLFVIAAAGGGPLTATVLALVDRGAAGQRRSEHAEEVLRGGAWIGVFERTAVFSALVAGWPEGLAVVLALKGLGRYNELRADTAEGTAVDRGGVAERFIIGTFASVLWAVGCAGAYLGLTA
jgi:hypothetical protein